MQTFDVVVIGTGSAGKKTAEKLRESGKKVAIIDKQPFGGTCSQRGCDPKKILVGAAELVARSKQLAGKGIDTIATIDWAALMDYKKTFTDPIPQRTEKSLAEEDIAAFHGTATFTAADTVRAGDVSLRASQFVIATGARPAPLDIPGESLLIDSTAFLALPHLPADLVLVGGGYIAFEFAHVAALAGARVTIVHQGDRPLEGFDPDLVQLLVKATEGLGIQVLVEAKVEAVEGKPGDLTVAVSQNGKSRTLHTALVVHAAGRQPDLADLALDKIGVEAGEKGVKVNDFLQSVSNPAVYACGDASDQGPPLTPLASYQASIVASNLLEGNQTRFEHRAVPSVVFTLPPLATVGLSEEEAGKKGIRLKVTFQDTTDWYTAKRINEPAAGFKTLVDEDSGLVVGAHLLGTGSDELINLLTVAINQRIPADVIRKTLFAYPTHGSDLSYMF